MSEAVEIRMGLLRRGVSHEVFAERCGMGVVLLKEMLRGGEVSDGVRGEYASLLVESGEEEGNPLVEVIAEEEEEEFADEHGEEGDNKGCVFGRAVRNDVLQLVVFPDGSEGLARKKRGFKPREGLPCEVETSDEEGFLNLVGKYRDNGVRLD